MKRPLAYLTAAWSGEPDIDMELAAHYCRLAYEAGFSPICPLLYLPLFLNDSVPEEHKAGIDMRRDMLRRSHTLIVCGGAVDEDVKNDIAVAGRLGIAATTLDGVLAVKGHGGPGHAGHYKAVCRPQISEQCHSDRDRVPYHEHTPEDTRQRPQLKRLRHRLVRLGQDKVLADPAAPSSPFLVCGGGPEGRHPRPVRAIPATGEI